MAYGAGAVQTFPTPADSFNAAVHFAFWAHTFGFISDPQTQHAWVVCMVFAYEVLVFWHEFFSSGDFRYLLLILRGKLKCHFFRKDFPYLPV